MYAPKCVLYTYVYTDNMEQKIKKSPYFLDIEPSAGLFDRIILAIQREQDLRSTKRSAFGFLALLVASLMAAPFSWTLFASQIQDSGILQFIEVASSDVGAFFASWQEFSLAVVESLPIMGMTIFIINMILAVFTLRLFLYKKKLLVGYLLHVI